MPQEGRIQAEKRMQQVEARQADVERQLAALAAAADAAAAAHAAAVAAVQARYGASFQQYSAAHSLQAIMGGGGLPPGMQQLASSYGGGAAAGMQGTPGGAASLGSSYAPLLSPPSRSFRTQLRYADFSSSLLQQQGMAGMDRCVRVHGMWVRWVGVPSPGHGCTGRAQGTSAVQGSSPTGCLIFPCAR